MSRQPQPGKGNVARPPAQTPEREFVQGVGGSLRIPPLGAPAAALIPYEAQAGVRMCGAAALTMVYHSFGLDCRQAEIWKRIAQSDRRGAPCSRTKILARDARERGLATLTLQARDPWLILERCLEHSVRVIINHRAGEQSEVGHYSVLVGLNSTTVFLHDPEVGPAWEVSRDQLLKLWQPLGSRPEIAGQVLLALSSLPPAALPPCALCEARAPVAVSCPSCGVPIPLQPAVFLGCLAADCPMRSWECIFCPWCDRTWAEGVAEPQP